MGSVFSGCMLQNSCLVAVLCFFKSIVLVVKVQMVQNDAKFCGNSVLDCRFSSGRMCAQKLRLSHPRTWQQQEHPRTCAM